MSGDARSNVGRWNSWYREAALDVELYGDEQTNLIAADFLEDAKLVEHWGCGLGGFRKFCPVRYRGIDGSESADSILVRHILEHNYEWERILRNALESFRFKLCLILFTPFSPETGELKFWDEIGVPDLSFSTAEITRIIRDYAVHWNLIEVLKPTLSTLLSTSFKRCGVNQS